MSKAAKLNEAVCNVLTIVVAALRARLPYSVDFTLPRISIPPPIQM